MTDVGNAEFACSVDWPGENNTCSAANGTLPVIRSVTSDASTIKLEIISTPLPAWVNLTIQRDGSAVGTFSIAPHYEAVRWAAECGMDCRQAVETIAL